MKHIYNVRYGMLMGGGKDQWRILADSEDGNSKWLSTPKEFDPHNDILKTFSGSVYHIENYLMCKEDFVEQITKDIAANGYELY